MTPQEAIQILDQATSQANLPRIGHVQVQQALQIVAQLVNKPEEPKPEEPIE